MDMINILFDLLYGPRHYVWRNKDYDIPVTFIKIAGSKNGVEYAQVEYEGNTSYVPAKELFIVRGRK
jgi:hypothetical protein